MEFIESYHLTGLLIGICTFLIIGLFHPLVIKCEYYFGTRCWWMFLLWGIGGIIGALYVREVFWSSLLGVFAFSSFLDHFGNLRTKRQGEKRLVSDESEAESGL